MLRNGMFEVYINGLLVQSFVYGGVYPLPAKSGDGGGRIGVACNGNSTRADVSQLHMWEMGL